MPRVSVIMGVYNAEGNVAAALQSLKGQTFTDWECIVCDDGSKDNTWKVLNESVRDDSRFILRKHEQNRGLGAALNSCIHLARGEYLARQDADDISLPTRFEEQVAFLDEHPEVAVLGTHMALVGSDGQSWGSLQHPQIPERLEWLKGSRVAHPTVMMRRQSVVDVGRYDATAIRLEDYDLWFRMVGNGYRIVNLPKILYYFHLDRQDYTRQKLRHRLSEVRLRVRGSKMLNAPPSYYLYAIKPMASGFIPKGLLWWYHSRKFRQA